MDHDDYMTEAEARKWWEAQLSAYRQQIEPLAIKLAATFAPEKRAEAERMARIEIEKVLDTLEWPGLDAIRQGKPNA